MDGNATSTYRNAALLSLAAVTPDRVTTSAELDGRLAPVLERLRLPTGLLERIAGVHERRNWAEGESFDSATIEAGEKALAEAAVDPKLHQQVEGRLDVLRSKWAAGRQESRTDQGAEFDLDSASDEEMFALLDDELGR